MTLTDGSMKEWEGVGNRAMSATTGRQPGPAMRDGACGTRCAEGGPGLPGR